MMRCLVLGQLSTSGVDVPGMSFMGESALLSILYVLRLSPAVGMLTELRIDM